MKRYLVFLFFLIPIFLRADTSVSQFGFTWTWSEDRTVGQYANGDYYVVGSITLQSVTPTGSANRNGIMVNPVPKRYPSQGFDIYMSEGVGQGWTPSLNIRTQLPKVIATGSSICVCTGLANTSGKPTLDDFAVLTVVASAPASGSFRPPYCGTDKTHYWNESQLNYEIFRDLTPTAGSTTPNGAAANFERPWMEVSTSQKGYTGYRAASNQENYGRDMAKQIGTAMCALNLNYSDVDKRLLLVRFVQYGIDVYGAWKYNPTSSDAYWDDELGTVLGEKGALITAAMALNDSGMLALASAPLIFSFDRQTWIVSQADVGRTLVGLPSKPPPSRNYNSGDVGTPEWGGKHTNAKKYDNPDWSAIYRNVCYRGMFGVILGAQLTLGMKQIWNHDPAFLYMDRVVNVVGTPIFSDGEIPLTAREMWLAYRDLAGSGTPNVVAIPQISPPGGAFEGTVSVTITGATSGASYYYTTNGSTPTTSSTLYTGAFDVSSALTVKAIGVLSGYQNSPVASATFSPNQVVTPTFSPNGGNFIVPQDVTIATTTSGATLHWEANDPNVTTGSPTVSGTVNVDGTSTLYALGVKAGLTDSSIGSAQFRFEFMSDGTWDTAPLGSSLNDDFTIAWDMTASVAPMDGVVAIAETAADTYSDCSMLVRFAPSGVIDARNGSSYQAANTLNYAPGVKYHCVVNVDWSAKTYSITAAPEGGATVTIGTDFAFRTEAATPTSLDYLVWVSQSSNSHTIENVTFPNAATEPPPAPQNFQSTGYSLSWDDNADGYTVYQKDYGTADSTATTVYTGATPNTTVSPGNTRKVYWVRGSNSEGNSPKSSQITLPKKQDIEVQQIISK